MIRFCIACDEQLTGRQRYYCSDKCRKRYERILAQYPELSEVSPGMSAKRPLSDLFVRDASEFVREASAIAIVVVISYDDNGWGDVNRQMDTWAIKTNFKAEITRFALDWLKRNYPKWKFKLKSSDVNRS